MSRNEKNDRWVVGMSTNGKIQAPTVPAEVFYNLEDPTPPDDRELNF